MNKIRILLKSGIEEEFFYDKIVIENNTLFVLIKSSPSEEIFLYDDHSYKTIAAYTEWIRFIKEEDEKPD